jgi:hypothetical protein
VKLWFTTTARRQMEWNTARSLVGTAGFAQARCALIVDGELYAMVMSDAGNDLNHMCLCDDERRREVETVVKRDLKAAADVLATTRRKMIDLHRGNVAVTCNELGAPLSACLLDLESVVADSDEVKISTFMDLEKLLAS